MSKATAGTEIPELARKAGFDPVESFPNIWAGFNRGRMEAITLFIDETGGFAGARWHAQEEYVTIVDKRAPGERGKEGRPLTSNTKRRAVGMDEVRPEMIAWPFGLDIGYLDLKRRIRNPDWRNA